MWHRRILLVTILLLAIHRPTAYAAQVQEFVLDNGLKVLLLEDHKSPAVTFQVWYRVGGRNEKDGKSGLAHFLEHMMFKGTPTTGPEEYSRIIECVLLRDGSPHDLHQHAGRLRDGLRVLRQRPGRRGAQSDHRRNRRADAAAAAAAAGRRAAEPHRGDGHGRAAGQSRPPAAGAGEATQPDGPGHQRPADHDFAPSACRRPSIAWPTSTARYHLAVSLHAPDDELRNQLVPVNKNIGLRRSWRRPIATSKPRAGG